MRQSTRVIVQVLVTTALAFSLAGAAVVAADADPLQSPIPAPTEIPPPTEMPPPHDTLPTATAQPASAGKPANNDCAACVELVITLCDGSTMRVWAKAVGQ